MLNQDESMFFWRHEELNELRRQVEQEQQRQNQEARRGPAWPAEEKSPGNYGIEDDLNISKHI